MVSMHILLLMSFHLDQDVWTEKYLVNDDQEEGSEVDKVNHLHEVGTDHLQDKRDDQEVRDNIWVT